MLESPAGVGFSYSNTTADYNNTGDATTADDSYAFLVNWLERFPQYKTRDFYVSGDSYTGHYAPQLARVISINNQNTNRTVINLKGIAIGNALVDDVMIFGPGPYDHRWAHALNSDETHRDIHRYCDFSDVTNSLDDDRCRTATFKSTEEMGWIDRDNIYAPQCRWSSSLDDDSSAGSINFFDPCSDSYVLSYLNNAEVQKALHVNPTPWTFCNVNSTWKDWEIHVLPTIEHPISNSLRLPIESSWRPWYHADEVGGYVVGYKGLTFVTVRGAGHLVPWYQPQRSLTMIASFLQGVYPPPSPSS